MIDAVCVLLSCTQNGHSKCNRVKSRSKCYYLYLILGELTETGFLMRKNSLWLSYQKYLKSDHSKQDSSAKHQERPRLVTSKANPKYNVKPTVESRDVKEDKNIKLRLEDQPIVAQGHPGQPMKSRMLRKEASRPVRMNEHGGQGQPGNQVKPSENKVDFQGPLEQPVKSMTFEKKAFGHRAQDQNLDDNGKAAGRKLLNFQSLGEIDFEMEENEILPKLIEPELEIQPETGKLLPWERDGDFNDILKVGHVPE